MNIQDLTDEQLIRKVKSILCGMPGAMTQHPADKVFNRQCIHEYHNRGLHTGWLGDYVKVVVSHLPVLESDAS